MTVLTYIYVLALVYWLGGDLGTFLASRYITRGNLGVEARQTAFAILQECDLGPKLAMPITLGSGFHLASNYWSTLFPPSSALIVWAVVLIWLSLIVAQHLYHAATPKLSQIDLILRCLLAAAIAAAALITWQSGLPTYIALKMVIFAGLVACGIAVRFALRPFVLAYIKMTTEGATPATDQAMTQHLNHCRRYVWLIWLGLFVNAALGLKVITV